MTVEEISEVLDEVKHIMPSEDTDSIIETFNQNGGKKILEIRVVNEKFKDKKLLSVKDMCEYMSMGKDKVRELLSEAGCPFVFRLGGRIFANRTILDKWIDANSGHK